MFSTREGSDRTYLSRRSRFPSARVHILAPPRSGAENKSLDTLSVDHPDAGRTRYRCPSSRDSALEAFRHNPTDVASLHWPIDQERNHMSGPAVPLVLSRTAVSTTEPFNSRVKLTCLATVATPCQFRVKDPCGRSRPRLFIGGKDTCGSAVSN